MLILLPPSETKAVTPRRGTPTDPGSLSFPELAEVRLEMVEALTKLCAADPVGALAILGLSEGQTAEVERNAHLLDAPRVRVSSLYTGVLFDALDLASLTPNAKRRADKQIIVSSALFGALRLSDRVTPYRLSAGTILPGGLSSTAAWKAPLDAAMTAAAGKRPVLDLRSGSYASMWKPKGAAAERTLAVRVLQERIPGDESSRAIVSHFNKATKGRLVRALLESDAAPRTVDGLIEAITDLGFQVEPTPKRTPTRSVDVIVLEV